MISAFSYIKLLKESFLCSRVRSKKKTKVWIAQIQFIINDHANSFRVWITIPLAKGAKQKALFL